jgi:simple sugar transport system permease protein
MSPELLTALTASAITMAVPLLFAALGELLSERGGVLNIGLEGMMLAGAFSALAVALLSGSVALGVGTAVLVGAGLGALLAWFIVALNANQVVAGTALNLLAAGLTGAALTISGAAAAPIPGLASVPIIGAFFNQNLLGYAAFLLAPLIGFMLWQTLPGLRLRMVGENPYAAETQGVAVRRVRAAALVGCGALAAAGGAYLSVAYANTFVEGMSAGRGYIALAIVIVGRRTAGGIVLAALFFGFATALQFHFQALGLNVPFQFFLVLPYVLTLVVLAGFIGRAGAPAALGQPYER